MVEVTTFGETMLRLSPQRGQRLETASQLEFRTAGAESNVAIAASRLEVDAVWLSKLPNTSLGRRVRNDIRQHGVTPAIAWSDDGRQGTYYIEQGGQPRGTDVIYDRADAAITSATVEELSVRWIRESDVFFTTGITPALSETLYRTTSELLSVDTTTAFDLNYRSKLWSPQTARSAYDELLPDVDLLFVPERDAKTILNVDGGAESIAEQLRERYDCETVVVTRGSDGALASCPDGPVWQPSFGTETVDPIGTGDAFVGGFLSQRVRGESIADALEWGAATAALKRTIEGDLAVVTPREVESVIETGSSDIDR
ncbi:Sugar kinase, ribokinase family [Halalkaliarchaeum sp. AArc-CO]|uniref:bifunctional 2-dehydro-3-deoxygluconokinase/2-dehydro-3- deoxygalactonokinase n=1 Tax=unclassified Halalkaliarchaeum TaxID=2678344 RepID=UPI00217F1A47|nr:MULTISPECIES: bifunctional 2-dehydro-3-deoxygluconokinase/2-dehydro-3-deoxygalactonokinase [unclassified Halalkaliarchaeum]MDR5673826.1 bifunctional 2-dehydro-3-deoxygluconokinase/2-dehydro-3-deoxygalactonokinase [Halalkaliarchaeum sp. AArc-GB]UWG50960.1 Sugar kinase, ribokinase family [Halalkaliarchaeum sp. AArc-CO]